MELDIKKAYDNYDKLTEEEKEVVRRFMNSELRTIIAKVFGRELDMALGNCMLPLAQRGKGLASKK